LPLQDDLVSIPFYEGVRGGEYVVSDRSTQGNAGGQVTLRLRRLAPPELVGEAGSFLALGQMTKART
jgi:hypothetical protein